MVPTTLPPVIADAGEDAGRRVLEFFLVSIRNPNTRQAYARAVGQFFAWCDARGLRLSDISPLVVATYVEQHPGARPTVKQHLAAIRMCFDWLVSGQVLRVNPAVAVREPSHVVTRGKTPSLTAAQARTLLDSLDTTTLVGLRDLALLGVMANTFARVGAAIGLRVEDYYRNGKRWAFRLHEKGGKRHEVPAHHHAEAYVDAYLDAAGLWADRKGPLFRPVDRHGALLPRPLTRLAVLKMVKRRARAAGLPATTCCHTFRATGITAYLENGGTLEHAQAIACAPRSSGMPGTIPERGGGCQKLIQNLGIAPRGAGAIWKRRVFSGGAAGRLAERSCGSGGCRDSVRETLHFINKEEFSRRPREGPLVTRPRTFTSAAAPGGLVRVPPLPA